MRVDTELDKAECIIAQIHTLSFASTAHRGYLEAKLLESTGLSVCDGTVSKKFHIETQCCCERHSFIYTFYNMGSGVDDITLLVTVE